MTTWIKFAEYMHLNTSELSDYTYDVSMQIWIMLQIKKGIDMLNSECAKRILK